MTDFDREELAAECARGINLDMVSQVDLPYVERTLMEAFLFEDPIPDLTIGVTTSPSSDKYIVTIQGYKKLMNDVDWCNRFLGRDREPRLGNVIFSCTQMTTGDTGMCKVLHVKKIQMQQSDINERPSESERKHLGRRRKKRY